MRVDIERLHELKAELNKINRADIEALEFYEEGKKINVPLELIQKWRFIGLNNVEFITTDFYLGSEHV